MMNSTDEVRELRERGEGVPFERLRRITGYLVGSLERFNNGKAAEEHDRVKHGTDTEPEQYRNDMNKYII